MKGLQHVFLSAVIAFCWLSCETKQSQETAIDSGMLQLDSRRVLRPNGWSLSPAGKMIPLGDFPMNLVFSSAGKFMAVTNNGQSRQTIQLLDASSEKILDEAEIKKSRYDENMGAG